MIFQDLMNTARQRIQRRNRYTRLVEEIQGLTSRDLADMGANRDDMLRHAYLEVYGAR